MPERSRAREGGFDMYTWRLSKLKPMRDLPDWRLDSDYTDIRGWEIKDLEGNGIGKVEDLLVDTRSYIIPFAEVCYTGSVGSGCVHKLVPIDRLTIFNGIKLLQFNRPVDELERSPDYTYGHREFGPFYDYWGSRPAGVGRGETEMVREPEMEQLSETGLERPPESQPVTAEEILPETQPVVTHEPPEQTAEKIVNYAPGARKYPEKPEDRAT